MKTIISRLPEFDRPPAVVVGANSPTGLAVIRSLGRRGIPVIVLDSRRDAIGFSSRHALGLAAPDPAHADFIPFMEDLGGRLRRRGVVFPTQDQALLAVVRNRERLARCFVLPGTDNDKLLRILDKKIQFDLARAHGIPVPEAYAVGTAAERAAARRTMNFPVIVKPVYTTEFREKFHVKAMLADDGGQLDSLLEKVYPLDVIVQEFIPGGVDRHFMVGSYIDRTGRPLGIFTARKLRESPRRLGVCRIGESVLAPEAEALAMQLLGALGYSGISEVEFKCDPRDGRYKLIEVNPRSFMWMGLATAGGVDLPYLAYSEVLQEPQRTRVPGKRWIMAAQELRLTPWEVLKGQTSVRDWLSSWRNIALDGIFSASDPGPGLRYIGQKLFKSP